MNAAIPIDNQWLYLGIHKGCGGYILHYPNRIIGGNKNYKRCTRCKLDSTIHGATLTTE
jgi:hypothetical protein